MSSQILQTELANLIQESKRKYSDLRNAAEQSLNELKALPATSETQVAADLIRRPNFASPFVLACHTRQAKLATIGVVCIQRLAASRALPPERLGDALSGLRDTTSLSQDVQLKILQTLPALLQNYSDELNDELLSNTLNICATLQGSKTAAVANTAAATLQQLVVSAFEKVTIEDGKLRGSVSTRIIQVDGKDMTIGLATFDALRILDDLCRLVEGEKLEFLQIKSLNTGFVLELVESILTNNTRLFRSHSELMQVLRNRLMPLIVRFFSERQNFPQTLRIARILLILLRSYMTLLLAECEMALALLIHLLEPDASPSWKRILCMEVFRGLHAEPGLMRLIYTLYDDVPGRKDVVKDHMASLVRLASEKPSLIGVSHQSTIPSSVSHTRSNTEDQITLEAGGVAGVIGAAVNSADDNVTGISSEWSTVRTPYLELLDKSDAPSPPETYVYSLILNCISALSENLAKFILPLTVSDTKSKRRHKIGMHERQQSSDGGSRNLKRSDSTRSSASDSKRQTVPLNPLDLADHPQFAGIKSCAGIIDSCWPAILATCSTFLYAALDADFYHNLVRSFQKLTHVAGLLRQSTARDAFLTTLGKASMPMDGVNARRVSTSGPEGHHSELPETTTLNPEKTPGSPLETPKASFEAIRASLSTRNLLCLRALLNLGIALGPTLSQPGWSIILETLQNADLVIRVSAVVASRQYSVSNNGDNLGNDVPKANLGAETVAVQTAASKMFESTAEFPTGSFEAILEALMSLLSITERGIADNALSPMRSPHSPRRMGRVHQNTRSISLAIGKSQIQDDEMNFVLDKANELAKANIERLSIADLGDDEAWFILNTNLISFMVSGDYSSKIRLKASRTLNDVLVQTLNHGNLDDDLVKNRLQLRNLRSLQSQITSLYALRSKASNTTFAADIDVHEQALDTLKSILEQHGETFNAGWDLVFDLISTVFEQKSSQDEDEKLQVEESLPKSRRLVARSARLIRAAYSSLQLIASDFLPLLPAPCFLELVNSFSNFASQSQDFNISLTTTTFFWNVSDFLQNQSGQFSIEGTIDTSVSEESLSKLADDTDDRTSRGALWLLLLLQIVDLTTDDRSEIRNSAIRTLLRILDAYGPQLSSEAWYLCLNRVLFDMIDQVKAKALGVTTDRKKQESDEAKSWTETAVIMIKGSSDLMANFFDTIVQDDRFVKCWKRLLESFHALLEVKNYAYTEAIFSSLNDIMTHARTPDVLGKEAVQSAWLLWANNHPALQEEDLDIEDANQDALLAYFRSFQQIYRLYKDDLTDEQIETILHHIQAAIWNSVSSRYSVDIDHQSALQELAIQCLKALCRDMEDSQPAIVLCLADFTDAALTQWTADREKSRPSFVAFSKSAIDLLSWYIGEFGIKRDIFTDGSLMTALEHLANPIMKKYEWRGKDREPVIWQKATTAAVNILRVAVPYVDKTYSVSDRSGITRFWRCVVDIAHGIVSARNHSELGISPSFISSDEVFDIDAFNRLIPIIIPSLGSTNIPERLRRDFACALLPSSLIYPPQRTDPPIEALEEEPLRDLYIVRRGRTYDPAPTARSRIAYVLIDTMFDLAKATPPSTAQIGGSDEPPAPVASRISLARSILPYLILRASLPLKSYIADQPLRGLMPQPTPGRKELLHLLRRLVELQSEPAAIPDAPAFPAAATATTPEIAETPESVIEGMNPSLAKSRRRIHHLKYRKHLGWMYPLVVKAVRVSGRDNNGCEDGQVLEALVKILGVVGDCSRVSDDDDDDDEDEEE